MSCVEKKTLSLGNPNLHLPYAIPSYLIDRSDVLYSRDLEKWEMRVSLKELANDKFVDHMKLLDLGTNEFDS